MDQSTAKTIAIVIPVFNEAENVETLCSQLSAIIASLGQYRWQLIFVDDGSTDTTVEKLRSRADDLPITIVRLSRNFGHQSALRAGLDHAHADAVITMDGDLQHPPELISQLIDHWRQGCRIVHTTRRTDGARDGRARLISIAYRLINCLTEQSIVPESADFRLLDRVVVDLIKHIRPPDPMLRGLVAWAGFQTATVSYSVQPRFAGRSRYTFRQVFSLLISGIFDFSFRPLILAPLSAALLLTAAVIGYLFLGFSGIITAVIAVAACQLFALAMVGIYLSRWYRQSLDRPMYVIANRLNFDD